MSDQNQKPEVVQGIKEVFGNLPAASVPGKPVQVAPIAKDPNAVALGGKAYGKPKTLTDEERARRSDHMKRVTAERVARLQTQAPSPVPVPAGPVVPAVSAPSSSGVAGTGTRVVSTGQPVKRPMRYVSKGIAPSSRAYPARKTR
jgi:hypothetical protein